MTQEQWDRVFNLFHEALDKPPAERTAFLESACPDREIRAEVGSLLANSSDADPFLSRPALEGARDAIDAAIESPEAEREQLISGLAGATIAARYRIVGCIGKGGYAIVLLALDERVGNRKVVLKVLDGETVRHTANRDWIERKFREEMESLARINHPGVVGISDCGRLAGGQPFLVMNFVDGVNLRERMRTPVGREEAAEIIRQMGSALSAAHAAGVVHLDLKPENVMLARAGEDGPISVRLIDFGLARIENPNPTASPADGLVAGTASYMAPEQFRGIASPACDIYAMGVICFELLTGSRPQILGPGHELPGGVRPLLTPAFAQEPEKRPSNAEVFGESLSRTLLGRAPRRRFAIVTAVAAIIIMTAAAYFWKRAHTPPLTDKDVLVLADFSNSTGDPVFNGTLREALAIALEQSPFLKIMTDGEMGQALRLMGRRIDEPVTNGIAREICQRENEKAMIGGAIVRFNKAYVVTLDATNCATAEVLDREQVQVGDKERVLAAVSEAAAGIRAKLGESLGSIRLLNQPLAQVSTPSLEALQSFALGIAETKKTGSQISEIPFLKRATELDPNFAMAWQRFGIVYTNADDRRTAEGYFRKAFSLVDHVTQREKLDISGLYYSQVTGEREKAIDTFRLYAGTYPREPRPHLFLGNLYVEGGEYERAIPEFTEVVRLSPRGSDGYNNLAAAYVTLDRFADAESTIRSAFARQISNSALHLLLLTTAERLPDKRTQKEELLWFTGRPNEYQALSMESWSAAAEGRMSDALRLSHRSIDEAARKNLAGAVAMYKSYEAEFESVAGNCEGTSLKEGDDLRNDQTDNFQKLFALALCGKESLNRKPAIAVAKHASESTIWKAVYLPTLNASAEVRHKQPERAVEMLESAAPYERAYTEPIYVRGLAYLDLGRGPEALAEFQKILSHKGANWGILYAASLVGAARAASIAGDTPKAKKTYEDFFNLWKDADPDVPLLIAARKEYSLLH